MVQFYPRFSRRESSLSRLAICFLVLFAFGCRGNVGERAVAPVSGTVLMDGKPVATGEVVFELVAEGFSLGAPMNSDGTYEFEVNLPLGDYRVYLKPYSPPGVFSPEELEAFPPQLENVPAKYLNATESGLSAMVAKGENRISFELKANSP